MLEVIGDVILMLSIIVGAIVFTKVNVDYCPNQCSKENTEGDNK